MLRTRLLALKRDDDNLYPSNLAGDRQPSITVSALALQTLAEFREPLADLVYRAIVDAAQPLGSSGRPWPAQGGGPPHTVAAAWAVFACARYRLDAVHDMAQAVAWLLSLESEADGGWPHIEGGDTRPFHTALVLNALLAYRERLALVPLPPSEVSDPALQTAIRRGFEYLTGRALSSASNSAGWFWDLRPQGSGVCLATSSLCLHVALKAASVDPGLRSLRMPACASLAAIACAMRPGTLGNQFLTIDRVEPAIPVWPQIGENEPSYWYSYFTPLLALTFADASLACQGAEQCYARAIHECVRWTVYDYDPDGTATNAKGAWGIAHALLVLRRTARVVTPTIAATSPIPQALRELGPLSVNEWAEFKILCDAVDPSLLGRVTSPATAESWWSDLVDQIARDASKMLRLLSVLCERHPESPSSKRIRDILSGG